MGLRNCMDSVPFGLPANTPNALKDGLDLAHCLVYMWPKAETSSAGQLIYSSRDLLIQRP